MEQEKTLYFFVSYTRRRPRCLDHEALTKAQESAPWLVILNAT